MPTLTFPAAFLLAGMGAPAGSSQTASAARTKLQFAQEAAIAGMQLVPPEAGIGLWEFATALQGRDDYRELVPTGPVGDPISGQNRLSNLVAAVRGLTPRGDTGCTTRRWPPSGR